MIYYILNSNITGLMLFCLALGYFLAVTIAITFHEFAHAFIAYKCGDDTAKLMGRMTLNPFAHLSGIGILCFLFVGFGWAKPVEVNPMKFHNYKKGNALVSLSGILTNLILALVFSGFYYLLCHFYGSDVTMYSNYLLVFLNYFLLFTFVVNLSLAIFNILPIYPLDGFNFIATFLKYNNPFVQFMYKYGNILLLILIITPVFDIFYDFVMTGFLGVFDLFWGLFL